MLIAEMQKLKEKYPQYKDIPDSTLLETVVKKYPVYKPIAEREFGTIRKAPPTIKSTVEKGFEKYVAPSAIVGAQVTSKALEHLDRPFGAIRALAAGKSPIEGFVKPKEQPPFVDIIPIKGKWPMGWGIEDPEQEFWVRASVGIAADLGTLHLVYGTLPKTIGAAATKLKDMYTGAQGKALNQLKDVLATEFRGAGMSVEGARQTADIAVYKRLVNAGITKRTPSSIMKSVNLIRANKGKLGEFMKQTADTAKANASKQGFTKEWFRKAMAPAPAITGESKAMLPYKTIRLGEPLAVSSKIELMKEAIPTATLDKRVNVLIKARHGKVTTGTLEKITQKVEDYDPVFLKRHPELAGKSITVYHDPIKGEDLAVVDDRTNKVVEILSRKLSQPKAAAIPKGAKVMSKEDFKQRLIADRLARPPVTPEALDANPALASDVLNQGAKHTPEVRAKARTIKSEPISQIAKDKPTIALPKHEIGASYVVKYRTPMGIKETMWKGDELNLIESNLARNLISKDSSGVPIIGIVDTFQFKGETALANMSVLDDAIKNLEGFVEEKTASFSVITKRFGTPFFIGEKYPPFKPIYTAVRDSIDYSQELAYTGLHLLNPKFLRALPKHSQERIVDALRLGNMEKREIGDAELKTNFGFNDDEIKGFKSFRKMYNYDTNVAIKRRKMVGDYETLSPEAKAKADAHIAKEVKSFDGYVSQTRLGGNWATYIEIEDATDPNFPFFYNLHPNKAEALKEAHLMGGSDANVYLRRNLNPTVYGRMSIIDLEGLADAAGVEADSTDLSALVGELQKRSFSAHWIKRKNIPGYKWDMESMLNSAIDYNQGATSGLARAVGRTNANRAYASSLSKMTPELKKYAADYINDYFSTGAIGMKDLQHLFFNWGIALKPSQMAQNLSQPLATTLSSMLEYYPLVEGHGVFLKSYDLAGRYSMYKMDGKRHGLSSDLIHYLNKLDRQGELGEQMVKFMMDARTFSRAGFDQITGSSMRVVEFLNRTHAAIVGRASAMDKAGLTTKDAILTFGKDFISRTQFSYGKHNLPTLITGAGNARNLLRLMYTFRHYQVSNLQRIMQMAPWRGAKMKQWMSAIGAALALHGWKGLPFVGLASLMYKKATGSTLEYDIRDKMDEAGLPDYAIDLATVGLLSLVGADVSQLVGMGDVIPAYGNLAENIMGAPAGFARQLTSAAFYMSRGDPLRALEYASPGVLKNLQRGLRYAREGVRNASNELIATPSARDNILTGLGFPALSITKRWKAEETEQAMKSKSMLTSGDWNRMLAKKRFENDIEGYRDLRRRISEHNRTAPRGKKITVDETSIRERLNKMRGREERSPRKLRQRIERVRELLGKRRGGE